jgi:hypothetical protein
MDTSTIDCEKLTIIVAGRTILRDIWDKTRKSPSLKKPIRRRIIPKIMIAMKHPAFIKISCIVSPYERLLFTLYHHKTKEKDGIYIIFLARIL